LSALLTLANVSAGYGSFRALFDVSLEVAHGQAVGVIGPNGAGKTTLMRVISGLLPPRDGAMTLDGRAVGGLPAHRMVEQGIAHVPENRRLFPRLSVEDNLRIGAFIPQARAHYAEQLERVYGLFPRLKDRRAQLAGTLSGGEQQMCAIGRALMSRPKMILLDEPSMGLAPQIVEEIFEIVHGLNEKEGVSFLLAEQNTHMALRFARYGYILENGRVVMDGDAKSLAENEDVKEFYLGIAEGKRKSFREGKHYRRRKRWLA
jgi:branched-chain amino acid transport system ATP-binding protein